MRLALTTHGYVLVASLLVVSACQQSTTAPKTPSEHRVRYELAWSDDGVEKNQDGSWEVVNDLGYRVRVNRGYVTSYSMELVECPKEVSVAPLARFAALVAAAIEPAAYAGHLSGTPNPAAVRTMQVESLTTPASRDASTVVLTPQAYCQLHYLVARADPGAAGLPPDLDMADTSLHIDGTYRVPGGDADVPFTIHTPTAYGALFDHALNAAAPMHVDTGSESVRVIVRRCLAPMFDRVDFAKMKPSLVASQTLKSLVDHVQVEIISTDEKP